MYLKVTFPFLLATMFFSQSLEGTSALVPMAVDINVNAALIASFHFSEFFRGIHGALYF